MKKLLPLMVLLAGCGNSDDINGIVTQLQGKWTQDCQGAGGQSTNTYLVFEGDKMTGVTESYFGNTNCQNLDLRVDIVRRITAIGGDAGNIAGSQAIDYRHVYRRYTAITTLGVNTANTIALCGRNDWELGVTYEVNDAICSGDIIPSGDEEFFSVFKFEDTGTNYRLYDGVGISNPNTRERRHKTIDSLFYTQAYSDDE